MLFLGDGDTTTIVQFLNILALGKHIPVSILEIMHFQGCLSD